MLSVLVFVSVLTLTSACQRRCIPDLWEGREGFQTGYSTGGKSGIAKGVAKVSFNATGGMVAAKEVVYVDGKKMAFDVIQDFRRGQQYTIYFEKKWKRVCRVTAIPRMRRPGCIPEKAQSLGDSYYGAGSDTLKTTSFYWTEGGINAYFVVSKSGCVPIAESLDGRVNGTGFMSGVGFTDITPGIRDPRVFRVPAICRRKSNDVQMPFPVMGAFRVRPSVYQ